MKVGDLVKVKGSFRYECDDYDQVGVVIKTGRFCFSPKYIEDDGMRADVMIDGMLRRFMHSSLDVISESR